MSDRIEKVIVYRLRERVSDCGPPAKKNDACKVIANASLPFPECCPIYECQDGVQLEFIELPKA